LEGDGTVTAEATASTFSADGERRKRKASEILRLLWSGSSQDDGHFEGDGEDGDDGGPSAILDRMASGWRRLQRRRRV